MDLEPLQEIAELLEENRQLVLYGPPGTGKTYLAKHLAAELAGDTTDERVKLVQFHPSYAYEDFFEGFRPDKTDEGQVSFKLVAGPLRRLAEEAAKPGNESKPYFLIIDEMNRANLAKVFGELYFLLEYRDDRIYLQYSPNEPFTLPDNLYIIGTMNTADRSIAMMDAAIRRRFSFIELHPKTEPVKGSLLRFLQARDLDTTPALLLDALNDAIDEWDRDLMIGPSYFMKKSAQTPKGLRRIWKYELMPLLEEHYHGQLNRAQLEERFGLDQLLGRLAARLAWPQRRPADGRSPAGRGQPSRGLRRRRLPAHRPRRALRRRRGAARPGQRRLRQRQRPGEGLADGHGPVPDRTGGQGRLRAHPAGAAGGAAEGPARSEPAAVPARLRRGPGLPGRFRRRGRGHRPVERPGRVPGAARGPGAEPRRAAGLPHGRRIPPDGQGPDPDVGPDFPPARACWCRWKSPTTSSPRTSRRTGSCAPRWNGCPRCRGVRPEVLSRLRQLKGKLDAVTRLQSGAPLPPWRPSRMNTRYHAALRLAELILRNASAEAGDGKQQSASFVVDMAKVFEDFVGTALREAMAAYPGEMRLRYNALLNEAVRDSDRIVVQPGAVHLLGGRPVMVYDAKYKAAADAGRVPLGRPLPDAGLLHVPAGADGVAGLPGRRGNQAAPDPQHRHRHCGVPAGSVAAAVGNPGRRGGPRPAVLGRSGPAGQYRAGSTTG